MQYTWWSCRTRSIQKTNMVLVISSNITCQGHMLNLVCPICVCISAFTEFRCKYGLNSSFHIVSFLFYGLWTYLPVLDYSSSDAAVSTFQSQSFEDESEVKCEWLQRDSSPHLCWQQLLMLVAILNGSWHVLDALQWHGAISKLCKHDNVETQA